MTDFHTPPSPPSLEGLDPGRLLAGAVQAPALGAIAPLFPAYELLGRLGEGGSGAVYHARHRKLGREVAIKVLHPELAAGGDFAERLRREARAIARLHHPFVIGVHDFGDVDGIHYLVLEYCAGGTLRGLLGVPAARERALRALGHVAEVLEYAHAQGVAHRDLKPENVLLDAHGYPRVADYGLVSLHEPGTPQVTRTGDVLGTPHYMAPEQLAGGAVDARADVFALGVMIHEALTGRLPVGRFESPVAEALKVCRPALADAVMRALHVDPDQRAGAAELRAALERVPQAAATGEEGPAANRSAAAADPGSDTAEPDPAGEARADRRMRWYVGFAALVLLAMFLPWGSLGGSTAVGRVSADWYGYDCSLDLLGLVQLPYWLLVLAASLSASLVAHARFDRSARSPRWLEWTVALGGSVAVLSALVAFLSDDADLRLALGVFGGIELAPGIGIFVALVGFGGLLALCIRDVARVRLDRLRERRAAKRAQLMRHRKATLGREVRVRKRRKHAQKERGRSARDTSSQQPSPGDERSRSDTPHD
ncbi:MAG: protein kinase [Planctomycetes bacterium]|nr:protein kinase [Planctomycetota bacterium]